MPVIFVFNPRKKCKRDSRNHGHYWVVLFYYGRTIRAQQMEYFPQPVQYPYRHKPLRLEKRPLSKSPYARYRFGYSNFMGNDQPAKAGKVCVETTSTPLLAKVGYCEESRMCGNGATFQAFPVLHQENPILSH